VVLAGPIFWRIDDAPAELRFLKEFAPTAPDDLGITVGIAPAPPAPFMPPEYFGKPVVGLVLLWTGNPDEGQRVLAPTRAIAPPIADAVRLIPYVALQGMLDGGAPHGRHYSWKSHQYPTFPDALIDIFMARVGCATAPFFQINGWTVGGAVTRVDADATAVGERHGGFHLNIAAWPSQDPFAGLGPVRTSCRCGCRVVWVSRCRSRAVA
jgi:hypothetical protein